ncbi:MAG: MBL fold metallo-hydrolase [Myxococcota bacterium]
MRVRFQGVRGSIPVSGPAFARTGGNTTCVVLEHDGERLVLDGGTGLAALGQDLGCTSVHTTVLFTHVHWDHIQGVPFFAPLFHPGSRISFAGARTQWGGIEDSLRAQMKPPQFPVGLDAFAAQLGFLDVDPGHAFHIGPFRVEAAEMTHPNGVLVYRIDAGGKRVVFATDVEHGERLDRRLIEFAEGADLIIHDAQYTRPEYRGEVGPPRRGWGHSTWEDAVEVSTLAGIGRLALFHHDPTRDDAGVSAIEAAAQDRFAGAFAARESEVVVL